MCGCRGASRLGRCVACLDFAGAQALAAPRELHGDEGRLGVRTVGLAARAMSGSFGKQNCTDHALHVSYGSKAGLPACHSGHQGG
jgi:hypothetical protein